MDEHNPTWLDESFLQSVLQNSFEENVEIVEFTREPAVGPGKNYTSYIYRVRVVYTSNSSLQHRSTTLIVKEPIETGLMTDMSECSSLLDKEQIMYEVLLPSMNKKSKIAFGPKPFISPIKNIVVMEDLKEQGYIMSDSKNRLDYPHCKIVFEVLAKFHASSISCYHKDPELVSESVGVDTFWVDDTVMHQWMINAIDGTVKVVKEIDADKKFKNFLLRRADHIWNSTKMSVLPKKKGINVLNHGDLWDSNLLFMYDKSHNVTGVKFLDYQNMKFASPVVDLILFIWSSASEEVQENNQKDLYEVYINELNRNLERLGCRERLSMAELWEDLRAYTDWGLFVLCFCLPLQMSDPMNTLDLSTFRKEDFSTYKFHKLFEGAYYRSRLPSFTKNFSKFFL